MSLPEDAGEGSVRLSTLLSVGMIAVFLCSIVIPTPALGASQVSAPQTTKFRPKVKVTFDRSKFEVSYGKTLDLCMKVVPSTRFKPKIEFASDPEGVIEGKFGGSAECLTGFEPIQIKVSKLDCEEKPDLIINVNDKPVATLPGTVFLPDTTVATVAEVVGCGNGFGASKIYNVFFKSNIEGASPNFNDLSVHENLLFPKNECGLPEDFEDDFIIGESPAPSNAIRDANTFCVKDPTTCTTTIIQTFSIGACLTSPFITITFTAGNGVADVTRSDEGGQ